MERLNILNKVGVLDRDIYEKGTEIPIRIEHTYVYKKMSLIKKYNLVVTPNVLQLCEGRV